MNRYARTLRELCGRRAPQLRSYLIRTRFERGIFGLAATYSTAFLGAVPAGMTTAHIQEVGARADREADSEHVEVLIGLAKVFEEFTYLADTSNLSNDGQDVRIAACRERVLALCDLVESRLADRAAVTGRPDETHVW